MIRVFHTADLHLDAPFAGLSSEKSSTRRRGLRNCLSAMVEQAIKVEADVFVVAGDLFDSPRPAPDTADFVLSQLRRLAEAGIESVIIPGNHDFYSRGGIWDHYSSEGAAHVVVANTWEIVQVADGKLTVYGIACHERNSDRDVLSELQSDRSAGHAIALLHGSRDRAYFRGERCYPFAAESVDILPVDFLCLGHYHLPSAVGKLNKAAYSGSPEGLDFTEGGGHSALILEIERSRVTTKAMPTGSLSIVNEELDCTSFASQMDIRNVLRERAGADKLLRLVLTGAPPPEIDIDTGELAAELGEEFFHLELRDQTVAADFELDENLSVKGRFLRRMVALGEQAEGPEQSHLVAVATRRGLAALQGRGKKR